MVRKVLLVALVLIFLTSLALADEFWASKKSNKYHYPTCQWAKKIKEENLIIFKTPEEAIKSGYIPCKVCRPPAGSKSGKKLPSATWYSNVEGSDLGKTRSGN